MILVMLYINIKSDGITCPCYNRSLNTFHKLFMLIVIGCMLTKTSIKYIFVEHQNTAKVQRQTQNSRNDHFFFGSNDRCHI